MRFRGTVRSGTAPFLIAAFALALSFAVARARQDAPPPAPPDAPAADPNDQGPLVFPGPAPDLALIYTGGVAGYVEPCG